ncbi:MAG: FecR family protein [Patescibacteria group bacterium]
MKKWMIGVGLALVLLIGGGIWFWTLGSIDISTHPSQIILSIQTPTVEVRTGDAGTWHEVTGNTVLNPSDQVRTSEQGKAEITFFGSSVTRLHSGTTIVVEDAVHTLDRSETAQLRLHLVGGRVWSRVMSLFDLGSSFSVRTDSVVATVRGTAFDVSQSASGTTLWVSDSAVEVGATQAEGSPLSAKPFFISEGNMASHNNRGAWTAVEPIREEDRSSEWFQKNSNADQVFEQDVRAALVAELTGSGNARVGSALERFVRASEHVHLGVAGKEAPVLYSAYLGRRLMAIKTLIDEGKSGLAFQSLTPVEVEVGDRIKSPDADAFRPVIRRTLRKAMVILGDAPPSSPQYRLLQRLEDLSDLVSGNDQSAQLYGRMVAIDERLETASRLITSQALEEAGMSLDAADQGIKNVTSDLEALGSQFKTADDDALDAKREALVARASALHTMLDAAIAPPPAPVVETPTSTTDGITTPTSTPTTPATPGAVVPPTTPTTPPPTTPPPTAIDGPFDHITLSAQPNPVAAGSNTSLHVTGVKSDGKTVDLTTHATFSLVGNLGSLNGPTYHATQAGSVTINASVNDNGSVKTASTVIQINAPVTLVRIDVIPQGSTSVRPGMKVGLVVNAVYSSGLSSPVTASVVWQTSNAAVGSAAGGTFTAQPNGNGPVTITATYTESGVTKTGTADFIVN